jgi:hypothetical protein|nr:MAG TPA: hypothetical protein [Caudoviricetes sp.]
MSTTCLPNDGQTVGICPTQVRLGKDIYNICSPQGVERAHLDQNEQERTDVTDTVRLERLRVKA